MRIRKRQVPFPLSSLSPVPLSDPHLNRTPGVQLQLRDPTQPKAAGLLGNLTSRGGSHARFDNQPSDQPNQSLSPIGGGASGLDSSDDAGGPRKEEEEEEEKEKEKEKEKETKKDCLELLQGEDERGREGEPGNDIRKGGILGAEAVTWVLPESSATHQASGRWCDGEKAFPPKKRRSTFERRANDDSIMEKDKKMKTKMKTKMNKKCAQQNDNEGEQKETKEVLESTGAKKRARGGALMEGSRCSRVNGRGWRCCQQTLVGYSLCEHHLGKGRLRSMTSVRSRSLASSAAAKVEDDKSEPLPTPPSSLQENQPKDSTGLDSGGDGEDEDEKKPLLATKKRMKLGMVKARSISSLLGQTNNGHCCG